MTDFMGTITIGWLIAILFLLFTSKSDNDRFQIANKLSIGALGLLLGGRQPSSVNNREKIGLVTLVVFFSLIVWATCAGYIQQ